MGRPLLRGAYPNITPNIANYADLHLTIAVYWKPRSGRGNGHAAVIIDLDAWHAAANVNAQFPTMPGWMTNVSEYVSWVGGKIDWAPNLGSKGGLKGIANLFINDAGVWGGERSTANANSPFYEVYWPSVWVAVRGLDAAAMRAEWNAQQNKGGGAHWRLTDKNCATMAHKILKAGGGDAAATGHKRQIVWWPTDIIKYARSMSRNGAAVFDDSGAAGGE